MAKLLTVTFYSLCCVVSLVNGQQENFDPGILSNLSSFQSTDLIIPANARQDAGGPAGVGLAGAPPIPPPQNVPVEPLGPVGGPLGPNGLPDGFVPFGLNHIILIIVPMFKAKFQHLPKWISSAIKISMPITVFFDQLTVPPGMFTPGIGGLPFLGIPPPIGLPPPPPIGPVPPPPGGPLPPPQNAMGVSSPIAPNMQTSANNAYPFPESPYGYEGDTSSYSVGAESEMPETEEEDDGFDESYYQDEGRKLRRKRSIFVNRPIAPAPPFNETIHATERAALIPRLEGFLENSGFNGKACLLRALCEVHEAPLDHYGLLGELFTLFFSVSQSAYAETHLPEYLRAEVVGKTGDCSEYFRHCEHTIFSWEEVKRTKTKKVQRPFIVNVIDEVL